MRIFAVDNLGYINMLKMPMVHWAMRWGVLVFWAAAVSAQCPKENLMSAELCDGHIDQCIDNTDCTGQSICCSTGCAKVCILPASVKEPHTVQIGACRQMRSAVEKRSRSLGQYIPLPACTPSGDFAPIQCNDVAGNCFCVDHKTGFELAGTRQRSLDLVNCNEPNPCANFLCRMLCPYDFELDADGCPICECRDPCKDVTCPGNLECRLEELPCSDDICPPIPMCRQARTLDNFCPTGSPLKQVGERPFLCGPTESGPHCPPLFECIVHDGAEYGACCPATAEITKPGKCIIPTPLPKQCGSHCEEDIHCPGLAKCCSDDFCGKHCTEPQNVTVCLQQKLLAEILSINEFEGKGYVPECDEQGNFETRQCSRNGLVCWCVDQDGIKIPRSIGAADKVFCDNEGRAVASSSNVHIHQVNSNDTNEIPQTHRNRGRYTGTLFPSYVSPSQNSNNPPNNNNHRPTNNNNNNNSQPNNSPSNNITYSTGQYVDSTGHTLEYYFGKAPEVPTAPKVEYGGWTLVAADNSTASN